MKHHKIYYIVIFFFLANYTLSAQIRGIWLPPNGNNQKSSVTQWIGMVEAKITYHSPNVIHPYTGEDRSGNIWGKVVFAFKQKRKKQEENGEQELMPIPCFQYHTRY